MIRMSSITLQVTDDELVEVANAYGVLQRFLDKVVSPNELYRSEFLRGLEEARADVGSGAYSEVKTFDEFTQ